MRNETLNNENRKIEIHVCMIDMRRNEKNNENKEMKIYLNDE